MKKIILTLLMVVASATTWASAVKIGGIYYNLYTYGGNRATVTYDNSTSYSGDLKIPSKVSYGGKTYTVTEIGYAACYQDKDLTSVTIPETVTKIDNNAFTSCTSLKSVTIPASVVDMGAGVFSGTPWLDEYKKDTSHQYGNLLYINNVAYMATSTSITECEFKENTVCIAGYAFLLCKNLHTITIPASVAYMTGVAFKKCGLTSINVEEGNTVFDSRNNCNAVIKTSTNELVVGCPATVIPEDVRIIGSDAFCGRPGLKSVSIPKSVSSIVHSAFEECQELEYISVDKANTTYDSRDNCNAIIQTSTNKLFVVSKNTQIPNTVTSIADYAYMECDWLTSLTIPNSVKSIGSMCIYSCDNLTKVVLGSSLETISNYNFDFCKKLTEIHFLNPNPPTCGSSMFTYVSKDDCTLYVPRGSKSKYEAASVWNEFANIVEEDYVAKVPYTLNDTNGYFENEEDKDTYSQIDYKRTFNNTDWQTLYVPVSLSYDEWSSDFDIARLNDVHQYDDNSDGTVDRMELEAFLVTSGSIDPNTPYLIKAKTTGDKTLSAKADPVLYAAKENTFDCSSLNAYFYFTGTYSCLESELYYNRYLILEDNRLYCPDDFTALNAFRWYLEIKERTSSEVQARCVNISVADYDGGETTGIHLTEKVPTDNTVVGYYTMDGKRLGAPQHGMTIVRYADGTSRKIMK